MDIVHSAGGFKFRGARIVSGTVPAGGTVPFDFTLTEDRFFTGVAIKAYNSGHFDYGKLQVMYGDTVLDEFVLSWGISDELQILEIYRAHLPAGLKIRITYYSTGTEDVDFWVNAFLHEK